MKRPWVSRMTDSSLNDAWQLHHVPRRKRIQLSFAWKHHPVSTDTIWWTPTGVFVDDDHPLAEDVEKQLNVAFAMKKATYCCFFCQSATGEFANAHCWWKIPTGWWRCPLPALLMLLRPLVWQPLVNFIDIFPPLFAERRENLLQIISELPPCRYWSISQVYSLVQLHESTIIMLAAICVSESDCKTCTIFWL